MTIIPSFLKPRDDSSYEKNSANSENIKLRIGEIKKIFYPNDKENLSKRFIEYEVLVQHTQNGTAASKSYFNCTAINLFGGLADKITWTYREGTPSNSTFKEILDGGFSKGSKVLLLCINGESLNPVIIGGILNQTDGSQSKLTQKDNHGHNFHFVFNGVDCSINKDGELEVQYLGKTNIDGSRNDGVEEDVTETSLQFKKNGNFNINTKDDKQHVTLDHENGKINQKADKGWDVEVSSGKSTIKSNGLEVGDATDNMLLASTYRKAEQQLHTKMTMTLGVIQGLITTAGATITSAAAVPILASLAGAGTALTAAASQMAQLISAIQSFEANASTYLSTKNKND